MCEKLCWPCLKPRLLTLHPVSRVATQCCVRSRGAVLSKGCGVHLSTRGW